MSTPTEQTLLVISPVFNEQDHIERVARSVAEQTMPPDLWLVSDDGSDDGTLKTLEGLERELPFLQVVRASGAVIRTGDNLAAALEAQAFKRALAGVELRRFTHLGKLDGDIELPPNYFEELLADFRSRPRLGVTGGSIVERRTAGGNWVRVTAPEYHVHGALKLYSLECFEAIGGIEVRLGWDTIDETRARMLGYESRRRADLICLHHRPSGSAQGRLRGCARHGECAYVARYPVWWIGIRSLKFAVRWRPRVLAGAAFLWGYLHSALRSAERVEDPSFACFVRRELRTRVSPARLFRRRTANAPSA